MQTNDNKAVAADIKRYVIKDDWKDFEVKVEVNHSILTLERAQLINEFWSDHDYRLRDCDGDVVKAVIKLFGQNAICIFLSENGASFGPVPEWVANHKSRALRELEGWGGEAEGSENNGEYGWCGIRLLTASVDMPGFDDMTVEELGS